MIAQWQLSTLLGIRALAVSLALGLPTFSSDAEPASQELLNIGRAVSAQEISAWDTDIMPDGRGLRSGSGTPAVGAKIYANKCAACHGPTGIEGPFDVLVGRLPADEFSFTESPRTPKTIGNYWPYATTVFDYIKRAMPIASPGSLTDNMVIGEQLIQGF